MSLLWTRAMAWYDDDRDNEPEQHEDYRDARPYAERRPEYVHHIAFVHDVPHSGADEALSTVERHLGEGKVFAHPTDYGFTQVAGGRRDEQIFPDEIHHAIHDARHWKKYAEVEDVPTHNLRATQGWVRPSGVAHNLFHPEQRAPEEDGVEGDPDYDPEWDEDRHAEADANRDYEREHDSHFDHSRDHDSSHAYVYEDVNGTPYVIDGHHRTAADCVLGKAHTKAKVLRSERDPDSGQVKHSWTHPEYFGIEPEDED